MSRRRRVVKLLVGSVALSALSAALGGPGGWELNLVADLALGVYVTYLVEAGRRRAERTTKVRRIHRSRRGVPGFEFNEPVTARKRA